MVDELAGAAEIVTGALIAQAVEPGTGTDGHTTETACLNCGTPLTGSYCSNCGQHGHVHRTLTAFWHDLMHGVLHFEGKIWRTLPMLAWRPGELTRRYVHGERAKFVSPLALFLFSVFMMFAVISIMGGHLEAPTDFSTKATLGVQKSAVDIQRQIDAIDVKLAAGLKNKENTGDLWQERAALQGVLRAVEGGRSAATGSDGQFLDGFKTGWLRIDKGIAKANENPNLLLYKLQSSAYKFSWMLIPISVPFVWLLFFWRREYRIYDHAVFVTYSLSFLTVLITLAMVMSAIGIGSGIIALSMIFVPPIHLYRQLKSAYLLSRTGALVRTFLLLVAGMIAVLLFVAALLALGLMG